MNTTKIIASLVAGLGICTLGSWAQAPETEGTDPGPRGPGLGGGPGGPRGPRIAFSVLDANGDGSVTEEEFNKAHEAMRARGGLRGGGGPGRPEADRPAAGNDVERPRWRQRAGVSDGPREDGVERAERVESAERPERLGRAEREERGERGGPGPGPGLRRQGGGPGAGPGAGVGPGRWDRPERRDGGFDRPGPRRDGQGPGRGGFRGPGRDDDGKGRRPAMDGSGPHGPRGGRAALGAGEGCPRCGCPMGPGPRGDGYGRGMRRGGMRNRG